MDRGAGKATSKGSQRDMTEQLNTYRLHTYVVQNWNLNESKSPSSGPSLSLLQCHLQWDQSPCSFKNPGLSLIQWFPFPVPDTCPRCSRVSPGMIQRSAQMPPQRSLPWLAQAIHQALGHQLLSVTIPQLCFLSSLELDIISIIYVFGGSRSIFPSGKWKSYGIRASACSLFQPLCLEWGFIEYGPYIYLIWHNDK